jgi:hypothetical protein
MSFYTWSRRIFPVMLSVGLLCLFTSMGSSSSSVGVKSGPAGILLRATLVQSMSMSVSPQPGLWNSFLGSDSERDFPLIIKTNWVRGPGNVSIAVLSSDTLETVGASEPLAVIDSAAEDSPELRIDSSELPIASYSKNKVLTIRAQIL